MNISAALISFAAFNNNKNKINDNSKHHKMNNESKFLGKRVQKDLGT